MGLGFNTTIIIIIIIVKSNYILLLLLSFNIIIVVVKNICELPLNNQLLKYYHLFLKNILIFQVTFKSQYQ